MGAARVPKRLANKLLHMHGDTVTFIPRHTSSDALVDLASFLKDKTDKIPASLGDMETAGYNPYGVMFSDVVCL